MVSSVTGKLVDDLLEVSRMALVTKISKILRNCAIVVRLIDIIPALLFKNSPIMDHDNEQSFRVVERSNDKSCHELSRK